MESYTFLGLYILLQIGVIRLFFNLNLWKFNKEYWFLSQHDIVDEICFSLR